LKGRVFVYKDARLVWIVGSGFFEGSPVDLVAGDTYPFWLVFAFVEALDVTLVLRQMDLFFTDAAFAPSALVTTGTNSSLVLGVKLVNVTTLLTLFVSVADGGDAETLPLQVVVVASVTEELSVTRLTDGGGFGKLAWR